MTCPVLHTCALALAAAGRAAGLAVVGGTAIFLTAPLSLTWHAGTASSKLKAYEKPLDLCKRTPKQAMVEALQLKIMDPHPMHACMETLYICS